MSDNNYKIMKHADYYYIVGCACCSDDCNLHFIVDNEGLSIFGTLSAFNHYYDSNFFVNFWRNTKWKIKSICSILFNGYIEADTELIINDENHIDNIINALYDLKQQMINERQTNLNKGD